MDHGNVEKNEKQLHVLCLLVLYMPIYIYWTVAISIIVEDRRFYVCSFFFKCHIYWKRKKWNISIFFSVRTQQKDDCRKMTGLVSGWDNKSSPSVSLPFHCVLFTHTTRVVLSWLMPWKNLLPSLPASPPKTLWQFIIWGIQPCFFSTSIISGENERGGILNYWECQYLRPIGRYVHTPASRKNTF